MSRAKGKSAVVTGGAKGLGRAFGRTLAEAGAHVTLCDVLDEVDSTATDLQNEGLDVTGLVADAAAPADVQRVVRAASYVTGTVDILVNNAGTVAMTAPTDDWEKSLRDFDHVMDNNLRSAYLFGRAVAPLMVERGFGEIVNVSTDHVHTCGWPDDVGHENARTCPWKGARRPPGWVHLDLYDASKWALHGFTQNWAKMLRPHGVRVNNLCLGATDSGMMRGFFGFGDESGTEPPKELQDWWMSPEQVAGVLLELIDEGSYGRSGDNVGLWLGHPTVLPPPSPLLDIPPDFDITALADFGTPPA